MDRHRDTHWTADPQKLESYILHQLAEKEYELYTAHLADCGECSKRVQRERELIAGIRRYGRTEFKRRLRHRTRRDRERRFEWTQVASLAAAVLLMVGAVFAIRWFSDVEQRTSQSREIALRSDESSQHSVWIMGRVVTQRLEKRSAAKSSPGMIAGDKFRAADIQARRMPLADLPPDKRSDGGNAVRTLLERTKNGIRLIVYSDIVPDSSATNIEVLSADSLVVYFRGVEIAYHIPGGWNNGM